MAVDCSATDFEWVDPIPHDVLVGDRTENTSQFLKEGYLHVMEKLPDDATSSLSRAVKRVRSLSDPAILGVWSRRWCVLTKTSDGVHILLYKDQSSFSNLHMPRAVLPLDNCLKLSSLPTHNKSENTFMISLQKKDILFYTDKSCEVEGWLKVLEDTLQLQDAYCHSPLKGLPQQKLLRKDSQDKNGSNSLSRSVSMDTPLSPPPSVRESQQVRDSSSAAVSKGILATTAPHSSDHTSSLKKERSKTGSKSSIRRNLSFSLGRKNSEPQVQILQIKKLDT